MKFVERKSRRPAVPLVSLIDILTILLIFFIVTTRFQEEEMVEAEERRLDISLPTIADMEGAPATGQRVVLSLTAEGGIFLAGEPVASLEELPAALVAARAVDPEASFELEPDEAAPLGLVIGVWDALSQAGIEVGEVPARVLRRVP